MIAERQCSEREGLVNDAAYCADSFQTLANRLSETALNLKTGQSDVDSLVRVVRSRLDALQTSCSAYKRHYEEHGCVKSAG